MNKVRKNEKRGWYYSYNIIFDLKLSHQAKLVYIFLCRCADSDSQSFPSNNTIAEKCNISVTAVKKALKELVESKLLTKRKRYRNDGSQTSNLFEIYSEPYDETEESTDEERDLECDNKKSQNMHNQWGSKYDPQGSHIDTHPGQNTPTPQAEYDHHEGLPILRTIQKEVQSVNRSCEIPKGTDGQKDSLFELEHIKKKCEFYIFQDENICSMLEDAVEDMYFAKTLNVGSGEYPQNYVRSRMHKLHGAVLSYALEKIKSRTKNVDKVTNSKGYIISCIFNAITEYYSDVEVDPYLNSISSG